MNILNTLTEKDKPAFFELLGARFPYRFYKRIRDTAKASMKKKRVGECRISSLEILRVCEKDNYSCHYCGISHDEHIKRTGNRLTLDRKESLDDYTQLNCTLCCLFCNQLKGNVLNESEALIVCPIIRKAHERVYTHFKSINPKVGFIVKSDQLSVTPHYENI